ncbi:hypothetical protein QVD17_30484 [Tagetes erecta]|uniref:Reverse transcriptase zinc-binding domain-containing protein n=1 Tax=Tagetes erecta TaxID=13708 RepID=A0AAD8K2T3_TARER|nr:hypothetical protein QVD17_30484 [Tagetes erecta]
MHAVISNRFEVLKSDPGPSGTKTSEDDDIVEESGAGKLEMDTFTKKDGLNRRDDSEGASTPVKEFRECVNNIEVIDINSTGLQYTWTQKPKRGIGILKKIDRVMGNLNFVDLFPYTSALFHPYRVSDHSPCILRFEKPKKKKARAFKFANFLVSKKDFKKVVFQEWHKEVAGNEMFKVVKKLKLLKPPLRKLLYAQGNLHTRVDLLRKELDDIQIMVDKDPNDSGLRDKERACSLEYEKVAYDLELFLKQKAKVDWLKAGDSNTAFFHKMIKRKRHSEVHSCMILMKGLEEFRLVSGLAASVEKSTVFFCQVPLAIKRAIMCVMPFEEGFSTSAKVEDLVIDRNWRWPAAWYDLFPVLINIPVPVICNNRKDVSIWHDINGVERKFSIHNVWETIRYRSTEVDWYNIVWFTNCIPRHAFHVWLVCRKKLNTQDKMRTWDMNMRCCPLCVKDMDSHAHLFFECEYAIQVWKTVRTFTNLGHIEGVWDNIVSYLITSGKECKNIY